MGRLLLLVPTTSYRVGDFLDAARRLGVDVAVGSNRRQVLEQFAKGKTVTLDFTDLEKGVAQVRAYAREYPLHAIVPVDDEPVPLAAEASRARPTASMKSARVWPLSTSPRTRSSTDSTAVVTKRQPVWARVPR